MLDSTQRVLLVIVLLIVAAVTADAFPDAMSVNPNTSRLVDQWNREVYFHGANVVVKGFPWIPELEHWTWNTSFTEKDMAILEELGLNGIRLGTMWPGAEPKRGEYNLTYLHALRDLAHKARKYNIHSLLDMHQDVISEKFCGEGLPLWAVHSNKTNFPFPLQADPYKVNNSDQVPSHNACHSHYWGEYYFTDAVGSAFGNFYTNYNGTRDSWVNFWHQVAEVMKHSGDAVLGYELINEPWAGDEWKDLVLMIPSITDKTYLQPMYDQAAAAIRTTDTTHSIFFEGVTWDWFWSGFTHVPGGDAWQNKSVLSYHFYIPPDFSAPVQFKARHDDITRLKCGGFLTEFGIKGCAGCGDVDPSLIMDYAEKYHQSWLFWEFKPFHGYRTGHSNSIWLEDGSVNVTVAKTAARTYAQAVGGHLLKSAFNTTTGLFEMSYETTSLCTRPETEIYFSSKYHYASGYTFNMTTLPANAASFIVVNSTMTNRIHISTASPHVPVGTLIMVKIERQ